MGFYQPDHLLHVFLEFPVVFEFKGAVPDGAVAPVGDVILGKRFQYIFQKAVRDGVGIRFYFTAVFDCVPYFLPVAERQFI